MYYTKMKINKLLVFLLLAGSNCLLTSCPDTGDPLNPLPVYDTKTVTFEEDYFTNLIDSPQYGGPFLYGGQDFVWQDTATSLSGVAKSSMTEWGGNWDSGTAISNYVDADIKEHGDYLHQLAVPFSNGSRNFAVVWEGATIRFADDIAREVRSIDICPTTYLLNVMQNGNAFCKPLTESGTEFTIWVKADNGNGIGYSIAYNGRIPTSWEKFELHTLGKVKSLTFSFSGSDEGQFGLNTPRYMAIDNIVVWEDL